MDPKQTSYKKQVKNHFKGIKGEVKQLQNEMLNERQSPRKGFMIPPMKREEIDGIKQQDLDVLIDDSVKETAKIVKDRSSMNRHRYIDNNYELDDKLKPSWLKSGGDGNYNISSSRQSDNKNSKFERKNGYSKDTSDININLNKNGLRKKEMLHAHSAQVKLLENLVAQHSLSPRSQSPKLKANLRTTATQYSTENLHFLDKSSVNQPKYKSDQDSSSSKYLQRTESNRSSIGEEPFENSKRLTVTVRLNDETPTCGLDMSAEELPQFLHDQIKQYVRDQPDTASTRFGRSVGTEHSLRRYSKNEKLNMLGQSYDKQLNNSKSNIYQVEQINGNTYPINDVPDNEMPSPVGYQGIVSAKLYHVESLKGSQERSFSVTAVRKHTAQYRPSFDLEEASDAFSTKGTASDISSIVSQRTPKSSPIPYNVKELLELNKAHCRLHQEINKAKESVSRQSSDRRRSMENLDKTKGAVIENNSIYTKSPKHTSETFVKHEVRSSEGNKSVYRNGVTVDIERQTQDSKELDIEAADTSIKQPMNYTSLKQDASTETNKIVTVPFNDVVNSKIILPVVRKIHQRYISQFVQDMDIMEDLESMPAKVIELYREAIAKE